MIPATLNTVSVDLSAGSEHVFCASGTTVVVPGFLAVRGRQGQQERRGRGRRPQAAGDEAGRPRAAGTHPGRTAFHPAAAALHRSGAGEALEEYGIGRPSTYASIIQTLLFRKYVEMEGRSFRRPTSAARCPSSCPATSPSTWTTITAKLEDELDAVSRGEEEWIPLMARFWEPFKELVEDKKESVDRAEASGARELGTDPKTGKPVSVRLGRFGPYAAIGSTAEDAEEKPKFASLRPGQSMHTISLEDALELFLMPRAG